MSLTGFWLTDFPKGRVKRVTCGVTCPNRCT